MCFIVQGSIYQFDKIKNSLGLLLIKQRYCLVQEPAALASWWLPHFSPHHPLWEHSHRYFSLPLHCTSSMTIFLGLWVKVTSPEGDAARPQTCWLQATFCITLIPETSTNIPPGSFVKYFSLPLALVPPIHHPHWHSFERQKRISLNLDISYKDRIRDLC